MILSILRVAAAGDPTSLLREFESAVNGLRLPQAKVDTALSFYEEEDHYRSQDRETWTQWYNSSGYKERSREPLHTSVECSIVLNGKGYRETNTIAKKLFLSILQTYTLPPALRKKVEAASKFHMKPPRKPRLPRGGSTYFHYVKLYLEYMASLDMHVSTAKEAISKGVPHSDEGLPDAKSGPTKVKVGPFTLVNTGGFKDSVMQEVGEVVAKAASLLQSHGFGSVCYGDIQVTNTLSRGAVLAFYVPTHDDLYIRANIRADKTSLHTVLHELGHRHEKKFLSNESKVHDLYRQMSSQNLTSLPKPQAGDKMEFKGVKYTVLYPTLGPRGAPSVKLQVEETNRTATVPLDDYWRIQSAGEGKGVAPAGFVTSYAKKSPTENYAEMFAFYCQGKLSDEQKKAFEETVR